MKNFIFMLMVLFSITMFAQVEWDANVYPHNMSCIYEDNTDIWFGSPFGILKINKEDGSNQFLNTANYGISANSITSIKEDPEGNIWITHLSFYYESEESGGVSVIHQDGSSTHYTQANSGITTNNISDVEFDDEGNVWFAFSGEEDHGGIAKLVPETEEWTYYRKDNSVLNANHILELHKDATGTIWAAVYPDYDYENSQSLGGGLCKLAADGWVMYDDEIVAPPAGYNEAENWEIGNIEEDSQGNLWFGLNGNVPTDTQAKGLYKFDGETFTCYQTPNYNDLYLSNYWHVAIDGEENIWVQSCAATVAKFDGENWDVFHGEDWPTLGVVFLQNIFSDSTGRIWISKSDDNLIYYENGSFHIYEYNLPENPMTYNIFNDLESHNGDMFYGTGYPFWGPLPANNALITYDDVSWNTYGYDDFANYIVNGISWDGNDRLILATGQEDQTSSQMADNYGGVAILDDGEWIIHNMFTSNYPYYAANAAVVDNYGNIWCANQMYGIIFYDGEQWTVYNATTTPLYSDVITDIEYNPIMNEIWASSAAGLYKISINEDGAESWDSYIPTNSPLETGIIYDIYLDNNYTPWFGTDAGLASWNGTELVTYDDVIGQPIVYDITSDEFGRIWMGTMYNGVMMMDGETIESWTTSNSPLPKNRIETVSCDQKGNVWLHPEINGLYKLNYDNMTQNSNDITSPKVLQASNYPNPFNPETTISFNIADAGKVNVEIFNTKGQKVKTLLEEDIPAGQHSLIWNGTDSNGNQVGSGVYFYRIQHNSNSVTQKMILIK